MRRRRKLVDPDVLIEIIPKKNDGVPLARLIRDYNLDLTVPHLQKLLYIAEDLQESNAAKFIPEYRKTVYASLAPEWIVGTRAALEAPIDWEYEGNFPHGKWVQL